MFRRIARTVNQLKDHAAVAREVSAGLVEAVASVIRVHADYDAIMAEHVRQVRRAMSI
jgi:hypothetical protein